MRMRRTFCREPSRSRSSSPVPAARTLTISAAWWTTRSLSSQPISRRADGSGRTTRALVTSTGAVTTCSALFCSAARGARQAPRSFPRPYATWSPQRAARSLRTATKSMTGAPRARTILCSQCTHSSTASMSFTPLASCPPPSQRPRCTTPPPSRTRRRSATGPCGRPTLLRRPFRTTRSGPTSGCWITASSACSQPHLEPARRP